MKNKKRNMILLIIFTVILAILIGGFKLYKGIYTVDAKKIQNLIKTPYKVNIVNSTKDTVDINIIGEISVNDLEDLTSKVYKSYNLNSLKNINLTILNNGNNSENTNRFYINGIISKISIDYVNKKASIGTFQTVPSIRDEGKINLLNSNDEDNISIKVKDRNAVININTDLVDSSINIVNQIKTYINVFRDSNQNTDFKSVEVHVNSISGNTNYGFNTDFDNTLETIKIINYSEI